MVDWMCGEEGGRRAEWVGGGRAGTREGKDGGREGKEAGKEVAYIWWKGVEEWAELVAGWVEETGQKGVVLTLYEITEGEGTLAQGIFPHTPHSLPSSAHPIYRLRGQRTRGMRWVEGVVGTPWLTDFPDFHGLDPDILQKALAVLVKRGKAQVFGSEGGEGVKFF